MNDHLNMMLAADMALQAYRDQPAVNGYEITRHVHGNVQWFVARNANDLWVVFRGTDELADWLNNLNAIKVKTDGHGCVHKGFQDAVDSVWSEVMNEIHSTRRLERLSFVGHSFGGALAALSASRIFLKRWTPYLHLWTFGQPRCWDRSWAMMMDGMGTRYHRIYNAGDPVPHLPFFVRFQHAGTEIFFDEDGRIEKPTFGRRLKSAAQVVATQLFSSVMRMDAHSMVRYRENVLRLLEAQHGDN